MKSTLPKVLQPVLGKRMIACVLDSLREAGIDRPIVVVGHGGEQVIEVLGDRATFAWQKEQLGTGHAVQCALPQLERIEGDVIVTCGDTPLISPQSYIALLEERTRGGYAAVAASMVLEDPKSYGRMVRVANGDLKGIVEFRDANTKERAIREVNTGTYCFGATELRSALTKLKNNNAQGEYYLTDTLGILIREKKRVGAVVNERPDEFLGVNDTADLALAEASMSAQLRIRHHANGVIIENHHAVRIEPDVQIGPRTRIRMGVTLEGETRIGADCIIGPHVTLRNCVVPDGSRVEAGSVICPSK